MPKISSPARTIDARLAGWLGETLQRRDGAISQQVLADSCGCSRQALQRILGDECDMRVRQYVAMLGSDVLADSEKLDLAQTVHHGTAISPGLDGGCSGDFNGDGREDKSDLLCGLIETSRNLTQSLERAYANRDGRSFSQSVGGEMNADFAEAMEHLRSLRHLAEKLTAVPLRAA